MQPIEHFLLLVGEIGDDSMQKQRSLIEERLMGNRDRRGREAKKPKKAKEKNRNRRVNPDEITAPMMATTIRLMSTLPAKPETVAGKRKGRMGVWSSGPRVVHD